MTVIKPPDLVQGNRRNLAFAPSWSASGGYLNDEHHEIFEKMRGLPGRLDQAECEKLYEMGYQCGGVILELGIPGGRSTAIEVRGALAGTEGAPALPQYYGVDADAAHVKRAYRALAEAEVLDRCLLFHGNLARFLGEVPVVPTMVVLHCYEQIEALDTDLGVLARHLSPGTPVLCRAYSDDAVICGIVDGWIERGEYEPLGQFAGSLLLRAHGRRGQRPLRLSEEGFQEVRRALMERYLSDSPPMLADGDYTSVMDVTERAREELLGRGVQEVAIVGESAAEAEERLWCTVPAVEVYPPDLVQAERPGFVFAPSWSASEDSLPAECREIHKATSHLPGWQHPVDSEKLYEIAFHSGSVILEVGVYGGRSAIVELRGALAAAARDAALPRPQFYGVDVASGSVERGFKAATSAGVDEYCLFYHGNVARFLRDIPIVPTMVFVDGDHRYRGCWGDLRLLSRHLAPGTPVMCHDYGSITGVRRAVDEWVAKGAFEPMGRFAGSLLLRARGVAGRKPRGLSPRTFHRTRAALIDRYFSPTAPMLRRGHDDTPVRDLTVMARRDVHGPLSARHSCGRGAWPCAAPDGAPLPETMPGGGPWPRISIVTPSFNQGRYIEETILSVRNQGYPNVEHIIVDGGSTDETSEVVARYREGIAHYISEKDEGQSDAINKGFGLATGEILTWLNSDDMLAPGALAAAALAMQQSGSDMVAGECHIYRDGKLVDRHLTACDNGPLPLDDLLDIENCWMAGQFFYQPEVLFTRELWERAGAHVRRDLYHSMDYELWLRFAHAGARLHVLGRPIALFRAHEEQKTAGDIVGGFRAELPLARDAFLTRTGAKAPAARGPASHRRLRVVLFNDLGYAYGAGIAHRRLAEAFQAAGHEVFAVAAMKVDQQDAMPRSTYAEMAARIASFAPDLVVVGNLHGANLEAGVLGQLAARFPTAFVMHDLWLLTGRCAYTGKCRKYIEGCDHACTCEPGHPVLNLELVSSAWRSKRSILSSSANLHVWCNSRWALKRVDEALAASPQRPPADFIKFGFDLEVLRPRDKGTCRDLLGLPRDKFIIMSSASSVADPRKGLAHLAEALGILDLKDVLVTCVGRQDPNEMSPIPNMRALGYTKDPQRLAMIYAAADLFVGASLEEAFGQVFIEAAACGTPSVGYPVDGKPEAILDGVSGRLADSVNPAALAEVIDELYADPEYRGNLARWGRLWVENEWSVSSSYHRLYCAMRRHGLADQLGLARKIELVTDSPAAPDVELLHPTVPAWRPVSNFGHWEGPYPENSLPRCRWAYGPVASFEVHSETGGRNRLLISYRLFEGGQRVRLVHGGRTVAEEAVPVAAEEDRVLSFEVELAPGRNVLDLHFWRWASTGRPLALLITSITCFDSLHRLPQLMRSASGCAAGVAIEAKQQAPVPAN